MAEEKKLSGPDFTEGVSLTEFSDGGTLQGHTRGESILYPARRYLLRYRRILHPLWGPAGRRLDG